MDEQNITQKPYMAPATFAKTHGIKYEVGKKYDLSALGLGPHPAYGPIPEFEVVAVKETGELLEAKMQCQGVPGNPPCDKTIEVHAGDLFQKRRCEEDQRRYARKKAKGTVDPEVAKAKQTAKEQERISRLEAKEKDKLAKQQERHNKDQARIQEKISKLRAGGAAEDSKAKSEPETGGAHK